MYSTSARSGHERLICSETLWPLASGRTFNTTSAWRLRCAENAVTSPHHSTHVNMNCEQFAAFKLFKLFSPQRFLEDVHWYDVSRNGSRRFCLLLTLNFAAMALALARDWTCDCDIDYFPFCPALKTSRLGIACHLSAIIFSYLQCTKSNSIDFWGREATPHPPHLKHTHKTFP